MAKKSKLFDIKSFPMDLSRLVSIPIWAWFRVKKFTPQGTPYKEKIRGGAVIAANHTSMADPFLVSGTFWYRRVHFLAAESVMGGKLQSTLLRGAGAIGIDRHGADIEAINRSVEILQNGRLLAVFPQGSIHREEGLSSLKSGITLIAIRADVPIIPMMTLPKKHWYNRTKVIVGESIIPRSHIRGPFPSMQDIEGITDLLAQRMRELGEKTV